MIGWHAGVGHQKRSGGKSSNSATDDMARWCLIPVEGSSLMRS